MGAKTVIKKFQEIKLTEAQENAAKIFKQSLYIEDIQFEYSECTEESLQKVQLAFVPNLLDWLNRLQNLDNDQGVDAKVLVPLICAIHRHCWVRRRPYWWRR